MIRFRWLGALLDGIGRSDWRVPLVGAWAVFLLFPLWKTGWLNDDLYNSSLPGLCIYQNCSPVDDALSEINGWTFKVARINPLIHILKDASFWLLRDLFWYKTTVIALVLLNLFVFYRLLKRLGASPDLAALCCFLAATFIQFRLFPDPVLAFNGLLQWLFLGTILSLGAFHRYLTGGRFRWLALSVLLYLLTALTYEMTYLFWVLHAGIFLTTRGRWIRAAALVPFVAVAVLLTLASMWLRTLPGYAPQGYAVSLDARVVSETILKQIVAAWPVSYAGLTTSLVSPHVFTWKTVGAHLPTLAFGFATAALLITAVVRRGTGEQPRWGGLLILGLLLAVLPAPLIGVARRYQLELQYGIGHLPVYIEYFGVALLFTCGVGYLAARVRPGGVTAKILVGVVSLFFAAIAVVHCETNGRVVAVLRQPYFTPRREIEEVLDRGRLLEGVPADSTLVVDPFPWDYDGGKFFYCYHTGTRLKDVVPSRESEAVQLTSFPTRLKGAEEPDALRVRYAAPGTANGWAVAGKLHHLQAAANGVVSESEISQLRLAVRRGWHMGPDRPFVLHAVYVSSTSAETPRSVTIGPEEMRRAALTKNWTVYDVKLPVPYVEGESLWLEFNPPAPVVAQANATLSAPSTRP
ncbi:MAG TPA: hypothetical protein DDY78_14825 [Planctomycetales bacterium]|nr:hypothetical protein [Planctomycetales bacterium]